MSGFDVRRWLGTGAALGFMVAAPSPAQEVPEANAPKVESSRAILVQMAPHPRIGVSLEQCETIPPTTDCAWRVIGLVREGPAAVAGVRLNDVLEKVNGYAIGSPDGQRIIENLVSGKAVQLELKREVERLSLSVVPRILPAAAPGAVISFRLAQGEDHPSGAGWTVLHMGPEVGPQAYLAARLDSLRSKGQAFVFVGSDDHGRLSVRVSDRSDGRFIVEFDDANSPVRGARYVLESTEMAGLLKRKRDSLAVRIRAPMEAIRRVRRDRDSARERFAPRGSLRRVAGAEFLPLTGELAGNLTGVDGGLLVVHVIFDSPAARLGLQEGDVVTVVDGVRSTSVDVFRAALVEAYGEKSFDVKWIRKGIAHTGSLLAGRLERQAK